MIRPATKSDSYLIAILHSETLTTSFLAGLGLKFLSKLYAFLITSEKVWVYEENNEVLGFVSFSENSAGMMKRFLINCPGCILLLIIKTILEPVNLKRFIETFSAPFKSKESKNTNELVGLPSGELLSISVSPNCQKSGIGSQLVQTLEKQLIQQGIRKYKVIAGSSLLSANKFYLRNGFVFVSQITIHGNELSNIYTKEF